MVKLLGPTPYSSAPEPPEELLPDPQGNTVDDMKSCITHTNQEYTRIPIVLV